MYLSAPFLVLLCFATLAASTDPLTSQTVYNNMVRFAQFSSAAYQLSPTCPTVLTATVKNTFSIGSAVGFVAVDTQYSEIILSFKGSTSMEDFINDADIIPTDYSSPIAHQSCTIWDLCFVHNGFYSTWTSAQSTILGYIENWHSQHPTFSIVVTGHSLGGALTPFAALAIKGLGLGVPVILYSYGQPRVGTPAFASFVDAQLGSGNLFRGTHTTDAVPQLIPEALGYKHHTSEYWISADPAAASNTLACSGDEDGSCSDGHAQSFSDDLDLFSSNSPHQTYFGVAMGKSCSGN